MTMRIQSPAVFQQLRDELDLSGQAAPQMMLSGTVQPVIIVNPPGAFVATEVPWFGGAVHTSSGGNYPWFQIVANASPIRIDQLIFISGVSVEWAYGVFIAPVGTPANNVVEQYMQPPTALSGLVAQLPVGTLDMRYSEIAPGSVTRTNYPSSIQIPTNGSTEVLEFYEAPFILPPSYCLEAVCFTPNVRAGLTVHGAVLLG